MKLTTLRVVVIGVVAAVAAIGTATIVGSSPASSVSVKSNERQVARETTKRRAGRFTYVRTTFPIPAGSTVGVRGDAFCPRGSQLTGGFGSGSTVSPGDNVTLPAVLARADGGDRDKIADNGLRAFIENPTSLEAEGRVEAICERVKTRRRR